MPWKVLLVEGTVIFTLTFVVTALVSFIYSLVAHGTGVVDWESAIRFGLILGIVLSWTRSRAG